MRRDCNYFRDMLMVPCLLRSCECRRMALGMCDQSADFSFTCFKIACGLVRCAWERVGFLVGKKQVLRSCRGGAVFHRCWGEAGKSRLEKSSAAKFSERPNPHLSSRSTAAIRLHVRDRRSQSFGEILFWRRKSPHLGIPNGRFVRKKTAFVQGKDMAHSSHPSPEHGCLLLGLRFPR